MGASGVGKTSVIDSLYKTYSMKRLTVFTSRSTRNGDAKKSISKVEFERRMSSGELVCVNKHYGDYYGFSKSELESSSKSNELWLSDYGFKNWISFPYRKNTIGIVIRPKNIEDLLGNLRMAGRSNRRDEVAKEYNDIYSVLTEGWNNDKQVWCVINEFIGIEKVVNDVISIVETRANNGN